MRNRKWMMFLMSSLFAALILGACESGTIEKTGEATVEDGSKDDKEKDSGKGREDSTVGLEDEYGSLDTPVGSLDDITEPVTVTRVVDGDTIVIKNEKGEEETVRMLMIDTPETVHPDKEPQPLGEEASNFTTENLEGMDVRIERGDPEKDKYGRTLAHVWISGGYNELNVGDLLLRAGLARIAYAEPGDKYLDMFEESQEFAKKEKFGVWFVDGYVTDNGFDETAYHYKK